MPVPPECQPIADGIANLTAQEKAKRDALVALAGVDKWKAMQDLGALRQQIAEQQVLLGDCEKQHSSDLTTQVVVFDVPGNSGPNRIARAWQLTSAGQAVKQTTTVQNGVATLSGILGSTRQSFGITIEETDHPTVNGPDFRSGPLPAASQLNAPDPTGRIEIVILDPIVLTPDLVNQAAPPLPIQLSFPAGPVGTLSIAVTALQIVLNNGEVSLTANGTASSTATPPFGVPSTSPFTFANRIHIAPTFGMAASEIVEALLGPVPTLSVPGLVGTIVQTIAPLLSSSLLDRAVQPLLSVLNKAITDQVCGSLGLAALPSRSVLSVRELTADNDKLTLTPVLGAFGTILSDFQPSALDVVAKLLVLDVQPASISTSDPANRVAQGRVSLDIPAPPGGVTIQLSCDRTDVTAIDPASLVIAEGATTGAFTVTGIAQPLMTTGHVDATVSASLGSQTLTAPLSIRPEPPPTVAPTPAVPTAPPVTGVPQVASITLTVPPPLPRGQALRGTIKLDTVSYDLVTANVSFDPPGILPVSLRIAPESDIRYFDFTVGPSFPGNSLRITAWTDAGGVRKVIEVPVAT